MAASQSRKTTSAKAAADQYPRPKLACSRGAGCAVSSNAINIRALTSVRKSLIAGTSQDRRSPFSSPFWRTTTTSSTTSFARQITSCDTAPQLVAASFAASRLRHFTTLLRPNCAITCTFRNISTFTPRPHSTYRIAHTFGS
jgi:hypothetical protein